MEHIMVSNIMNHFDTHNILSDCRHGFRTQRSCETQLTTLVDELVRNIQGGGQFDMIVMDFSKAFDRVPHERLLRKLWTYGVRDKHLDWVRSFLTLRHQQVTLDGEESPPVHVDSGVPQGTVLGPLLFLAYINDLPDCVQSRVRLFADDCVIYRQIQSATDGVRLQQDLGHLEVWERTWQMSFHPDKCHVLRVTRSKNPRETPYTLNGHTLNSVTSTTYLGIDINNKLGWDTHINKACGKANRTLGFLKRNLRVGDRSTKARAYQQLVRPTLDYCSTVWDPHEVGLVRQIEMVQRRAARYVCRRYHNTSSVTSMLEELGWETLQQRRAKYRLSLLYKSIHGLVAVPLDEHTDINNRIEHRISFRKPHTRTNYFKFSFFPRTVHQWNHLPLDVVTSPTITGFKTGLVGRHIPNMN
jgi:ribonuclease P/MRP protein subunit RPP40